MVETARAMAQHELALGPLLLAFVVLAPPAWWLADQARGSRVAALAAAACLAAAVTVTLARPGLRGSSPDWSRAASACTITDVRSVSSEGLLNLVLLAPFAAFAVFAVGRPFLVAGFSVLVSVGIETAQAAFTIGACDSSDLLRNSAGAIAAALVAGVLRWVERMVREERAARDQAARDQAAQDHTARDQTAQDQASQDQTGYRSSAPAPGFRL